MKTTCPVCNRSEIEIDICPNCETDLSAIRFLTDLPRLESKDLKSNKGFNYLLNIGIISAVVLIIELGLHAWTLF
jgi:hypothetical protein